ncbi:MAG: hypothetical protein HZB15_17970 [Actinobacteria bacterium]|nr:hypothetical protein [Actinomycetota bacterium]
MVLAASDELRHPHDDGFNWRESLYFNFADARNGLGGWVYLWVVPNKPLKSGMLVSIYKGVTDTFAANQLALEAPGHRFVGDDDNWVYCVKHDVEPLIDADFDDVELCGLHLTRTGPLETYHISFADDAGSSIELDATFITPPVDYAEGIHPTPSWVAKNRYHRSWVCRGSIVIDGRTYSIDTTGDSDHSWGTRDMDEYSKHRFKMWSFQSPDGRSSVSAIDRDGVMFHGFINTDGSIESMKTITHTTDYDESGVQRNIDVIFTDGAGRSVRARMPEMFAAIGHGEPTGLWGFEGVGVYAVDGWGPCSGVTSYFWPAELNPAMLHEGVESRGH